MTDKGKKVMINTLAVFREISEKSVGERKMDNNSTYEQYEQEIDLKDLMFAVLHKWRPSLWRWSARSLAGPRVR